jgi:hypothetical protein
MSLETSLSWSPGLSRDAWTKQAHAEATITLASRHGLNAMAALGTLLQGWALAT